MFASGVALFLGDKATECSHCACHHEKQSAAQDKGQIHSNYCTLNMKVYTPIFLLCFNLGNSQIEGIIDGCNYEKIVKRDYRLMLHMEPLSSVKGNSFQCSGGIKAMQGYSVSYLHI